MVLGDCERVGTTLTLGFPSSPGWDHLGAVLWGILPVSPLLRVVHHLSWVQTEAESLEPPQPQRRKESSLDVTADTILHIEQ